MKYFIMTLSVLTCIFALLAASCEKDPSGNGQGNAKAAKLTIELNKHYNANGSINFKSWERGDQVAAFNADASTPSVQTSIPLSIGAQSSLFTIAVSEAHNGDNIMAYYPSSANLTCNVGSVLAKIPTKQNGKDIPSPVYVGTAKFTDAYSGSQMKMKPYWCVVRATLQKGAYSVTKAEITADGGEKIAGNVTINASDLAATGSESTITVEFDKPQDCRLDAISFVFIAAPSTLSNGFTIKYTTETGETFEYKNSESLVWGMGEKYEAKTSNSESTQVVVCGDNMIYILDAELAITSGYRNAILWEWDAKKYAAIVGQTENNMIRLDDAKPVDDNKKILATSSKGYAVLIDKETGDVLWHSNSSKNAHSADLLPNNRVAVACSEGGDMVQIFDIAKPNVVKFSTPLEHAHGVVWNPKTERLYAVGNSTFNIYKLTDWDTASPKLTLDKSIHTGTWVTGLHDLTLVDENTLLLAGNRAALYNIAQDTFTSIAIFDNSKTLKSVNFNSNSGECWFTDPTQIEVPDLTWASHTIRYTSNMLESYETRNFKIDDLNIYKVRVYNW